MNAPIPNSYRTDYIDRGGRVYRTEWGLGIPSANATGPVMAVNVTEPGQFPLGDCTRTTAYGGQGEPMFAVWAACPPEAAFGWMNAAA